MAIQYNSPDTLNEILKEKKALIFAEDLTPFYLALKHALPEEIKGAIFASNIPDSVPKEYRFELEINRPKVLATVLQERFSGKNAATTKREGFDLDLDIYTSMLTAVRNFIEDTAKQANPDQIDDGKNNGYVLQQFVQDETRALTVLGKEYALVTIYEGEESQDIKEHSIKVLRSIETKDDYKKELEEWKQVSDESKTHTIQNYLKEEFFTSKRYEGKLSSDILPFLPAITAHKIKNFYEKINEEETKILIFNLNNFNERDSKTLELLLRDPPKNTLIFGVYSISSLDENLENAHIKDLLDRLRTDNEFYINAVNIPLTKSLEDQINKQFESLSDVAKVILALATIAGDFSSKDILKKAGEYYGLEKSKIEEILSNIKTSALFSNYSPANKKIANLSLKILGEESKKAYESVAKALEETYTKEEIASILSTLWDFAQNKEKALEWSLLAAKQAEQRWALDEANRFYETAIKNCTDEKMLMQILKDKIYYGWFDTKNLRQLIEECTTLEALAEKHGDPEAKFFALLYKTKALSSVG
ncbi:MAG: hypothetical protein QXQ79_02865, partial [Candidatus Nanoarchaeia archaeon]